VNFLVLVYSIKTGVGIFTSRFVEPERRREAC